MSRQGPLGAAHSQSDRYRRRLLAAAGLSNNLLFSNLNTTMAVKSSASRTAPATAALGALSGYLAKRDEQHQWRRRFCVLAPQAFLYYFEDSSADAPRGVIDLEGADVSVGDGNVVHIVTPGTHDAEGRRFYFQADSADDAAAWVSALVRERYFNVRDERDAYRDLQHDLSAQAAASRDALDEATEANDEAERRHVAAARAEAELDDRLRSIARELDEDDDDSEGEECLEADVRSSILARMKRRGRRSMARIAALEAKLESKEASSEERARELRRHGAEVAQLEEELRREEARTQDEAETSARLDEETEELRREAQEASLNLEVVEQQAKAADARVAELQDQKRLLVREVKNARKALSDAEAANRAVLERALAEAPEVKRDSSEDEVERGPFTDEKPAFVVTCKRCGGDVAGPKNSTCVCSVPLLGEEGPSMADHASSEAKRVWRSMTKSLFSPAAAPPPPPKAPDDAPEAETPPPAAGR